MFNFCTLFDSNYLTRGLAMYESLNKHCTNFHLYIFPFDDKCYQVLSSLNLDKVTLVSLKEFEDDELLRVKPSRSKGEYCWTATSSTILYCIETFKLENCTYLDADLYFFNTPEILLKEVENKSVLITDHRYSPQYNKAYKNGKYCVQFVFFRNDASGMKVLRWWRDACIDWCYNRCEDGKFGDQKYLDDWLERFDNVVDLQHLGGGVAPWNVQQYEVYKNGDIEMIVPEGMNIEYPLVFFHFHELKFFTRKIIFLGEYKLTNKVIKLIYLPYLESLFSMETKEGLLKINYHERKIGYSIKYFVRFLVRRVYIFVLWRN
jgi:hypothetical protein